MCTCFLHRRGRWLLICVLGRQCQSLTESHTPSVEAFIGKPDLEPQFHFGWIMWMMRGLNVNNLNARLKRILMHLNVCRSKAACTTAHILTHQSIQADHSKLKAFLFSPLRIRLQQSTIWKAASFNTVSVCGALMCFTIYKCHFHMPALRQGSYLTWQTSQTRLLGLALFPVFC